ncbi:hypothetical protein ANN_12063 [Periplaneta americana]|uniref:Uncharacterized protein n=1 Tax=Periplaneta americana TaxID=6978 RepID=A0ABQ8T6U1_PERAM|nr:hypothetical protein ANN_12063 [Periplaneta americana]
MKFAIPRIWREPGNHHDDCYVKDKVYATPVRDLRDLRERIIEAIESISEDMLQHAWQEAVHRLDIVTVTAGAHCDQQANNVNDEKKSIYNPCIPHFISSHIETHVVAFDENSAACDRSKPTTLVFNSSSSSKRFEPSHVFMCMKRICKKCRHPSGRKFPVAQIFGNHFVQKSKTNLWKILTKLRHDEPAVCSNPFVNQTNQICIHDTPSTTSLFIMDIGSPIFEHTAPLSYTSFTHYVWLINFVILAMDFTSFTVFGHRKSYYRTYLAPGGTCDCSTYFDSTWLREEQRHDLDSTAARRVLLRGTLHRKSGATVSVVTHAI